MQSRSVPVDEYSTVQSQSEKFHASLATTQEEIREMQRLRYRVFNETFQSPWLANADASKEDEYDDYCDHLLVRDTRTLAVVGAYRLMSPTVAQRMGHYYSEKEFDLNRLASLRAKIVEVGHACVDPDYRGGSVIAMLWSGVATYMEHEGCDLVICCLSVSLSDGGHNAAALYRGLTAENIAPAEYRVTPHTPFPIHEFESEQVPSMPPLFKGLLRSGGRVCGEPAWDKEFNAADFFIVLPLSEMNSRYARHYLKPQKSF